MEKPKYLNTVGSFECQVIAPTLGWFGESKEKHTPFIRVPVQVIEGEHRGEVAVWTGWLSENAQDNTITRLAEVFGFDGDFATLHTGRQTLVGKPCNIEVESESYDAGGKTKTSYKVAWLNPPGGGGPKGTPMEAEKVNSLLKLLSAKGKALAKNVNGAKKASAPAAPAAVPEGATTGDDSDDVPF